VFLTQKTYECDNGVKVETLFIHESGEILSCGILHVPANKQDAQGYGSALTYCRRYSLMAACGIAPEDDDGNGASGETGTKKDTAKKPVGLDTNVVADFLLNISEAATFAELQKIYAAAYKAAQQLDDTKALEHFTIAKDKRKQALQLEMGDQP
jgi:hypothetical protein